MGGHTGRINQLSSTGQGGCMISLGKLSHPAQPEGYWRDLEERHPRQRQHSPLS